MTGYIVFTPARSAPAIMPRHVRMLLDVMPADHVAEYLNDGRCTARARRDVLAVWHTLIVAADHDEDALTPVITPAQALTVVTLFPEAYIAQRLRDYGAAQHVRHEVFIAWYRLASHARLARHGGDVEAAMTIPADEDPSGASAALSTSAAAERLGVTRERVGQYLRAGDLAEHQDSTSRRRRVTRASVEALWEARQKRTEKKPFPGDGPADAAAHAA